MVNQQFRRDYWVKGARKRSALEQAQALRAQKVILVTPSPDVTLKVTGTLGEANLDEKVYTPILDLLAHHKPMGLGQIEDAVKGHGIVFAQVVQAAVVLLGKGDLAPAQDDHVISKAKKHTDKLNAYLCQKARGSHDIGYLASPVTGEGVAVNRLQQLFLLAYSGGKKQAADWAQFAWQLLQAQGQRLVKEGKALETAEENLAELTAQAQTFAEKQLPILKALQIA